jgi:hypothetical protein
MVQRIHLMSRFIRAGLEGEFSVMRVMAHYRVALCAKVLYHHIECGCVVVRPHRLLQPDGRARGVAQSRLEGGEGCARLLEEKQGLGHGLDGCAGIGQRLVKACRLLWAEGGACIGEVLRGGERGSEAHSVARQPLRLDAGPVRRGGETAAEPQERILGCAQLLNQTRESRVLEQRPHL